MTNAADVIQEVIAKRRSDKDGELLLEALVRTHRAQSPAVREQFIGVYRDWLVSGDAIKADWAVTLMRRLRLIDELPLLMDVLGEIRDGRSRLPSYFVEFLEPSIKELEKAKSQM